MSEAALYTAVCRLGRSPLSPSCDVPEIYVNPVGSRPEMVWNIVRRGVVALLLGKLNFVNRSTLLKCNL